MRQWAPLILAAAIVGAIIASGCEGAPEPPTGPTPPPGVVIEPATPVVPIVPPAAAAEVTITGPSGLDCSVNDSRSCDWYATQVPDRGWSLYAREFRFEGSGDIHRIHVQVTENARLCNPEGEHPCGHMVLWSREADVRPGGNLWLTAVASYGGDIVITAQGYTRSGDPATYTVGINRG